MDFSTERQTADVVSASVGEGAEVQRYGLQATYSPEDNKLRLYSATRLDPETYQRVADAGFRYAPKQGLFVAPMWTPQRENLLTELCGEIGDEDTSLVDRAEERADRFNDYSDKRARDAEAARKAVSSLADGIPFGQPILVGHHSEARARKDAERIENGMRRAVKMWETSEYWQHRAAGALLHAKYKERPDVRHRRIKTIEADQRKAQRSLADINAAAVALAAPDLTCERAIDLANTSNVLYGLWSTLTKEPENYHTHCAQLLAGLERSRAHYERWLAHYGHRIAYERAMLDEQGGLKADRFDIQLGGQVKVRGEWVMVKRVNKKDGRISSVTTSCRYVPVRGIEEVQDYRPPSKEQAANEKAAAKLPPMCNYPGEGFHHMTKAEWDATHSDYKGSRELGQGSKRPGGYRPDLKNAAEASTQYGRHRVRSVVRMSALVAVYLTDAKRTDPPAAPAKPAAQTGPAELQQEAAPAAAAVEQCGYQTTSSTCSQPNTEGHQPIGCAACDTGTEQNLAAKAAAEPGPAEAFKTMREQLRAGVQVVSAPQLFPTPAALAVRMVELAEIEAGHSVLEPSAGTGSILRAVRSVACGSTIRTAVEINAGLCRELRRVDPGAHVFHADFLEWEGGTTKAYDRILANPPFGNAQDIAHIKRALQMLKPGGRLVAICANGPRQNAQLRPLVEQHGGKWEVLPPDTFAESGTGVSTVLLSLSV